MQSRTWDEWFWLPERNTWNEVELKMGNDYPNVRQFWKWSLFFGLFLFVVRKYCVMPLLLEPIARKAGIRSKPYKRPPKEEALEVLYCINRAQPPGKYLKEAASRIGWSERRVETWLRQKTLSKQMTTLEKFYDQSWEVVFCVCNLTCAIVLLMPQEYFWDSTKVMEGYPFQKIPNGVWWFCAMNCGYSINQTFTCLFQDRRHGIHQMVCHHTISLLLYTVSFNMNTIRLLTISVTIHGTADIFLTFSKMYDYARNDRLYDTLVVVFAIVSVCTRLVAYPIMVLLPMFTLKRSLGTTSWPSMLCAQILGILMLIIHLMWTRDLVDAVKVRLLRNREAFSDGRSSNEELSENDQNEK